MRKIQLLLIALVATASFCACQELVAENVKGSYSTGQQFVKEFQRPEWDNTRDFAVWGWFKIDSTLKRDDWTTVFHFTSNTGDAYLNVNNPGNRALVLQFVDKAAENKKRLSFPTYSTSQNNNNVYTINDDIGIAKEDFDKWVFFYNAHSSTASKNTAYVNLPVSGPKIQSYSNIVHNTSKYYKLLIGKGSHNYFQGLIYRVYIQGGAGAYRDSNFEQLTYIKPDALPTCVTFFSECGFTGVQTLLCGNIPELDLASVKSVYVPTGQQATFWKNANYQGASVVFNTNQECLTQGVTISFLQAKAGVNQKVSAKASRTPSYKLRKQY